MSKYSASFTRELLRVAAAAALLIFFVSSGIAASEDDKNALVIDNAAILDVELDPLSTTLFRWDDDTVGVLTPAGRIVQLFSAPPKTQRGRAFWSSRDLYLGPGLESGGAPIFPDLIQRHESGDLYWLSRSKNYIGVYSDRGSLKKIIPLRSDNYSWFEVRGDRTIVAHAASLHRGFHGFEFYSADGSLVDESIGWLQLESDDRPRLGQVFFFELSETQRVEILTAFPLARLNTAPREAREIACDAIPKNISEAFRTTRASNLLPAPLGSGLDVAHPAGPFALAATRGKGNEILLLVNGGTVVRVQLDKGWKFDCWMSPRLEGNHVSTSIATFGNRLAILSHEGDRQLARLRIWNLAGF